jgi:outer membrane protein OmpA-like peptidoglycan-associated protein
MKSVISRGLIGGALMLAGLSLGGCATEEYVDKAVANVQTQVDGLNTKVAGIQQQVAANSAAIGDQNTKIAQLDSANQANAAKIAALDKFSGNQVAAETVNFETASAKLSPEDEAKLTDLANRLKTENKNVHVEIYGNTDNRGGVAYNDALGARRAEAVKQFLDKQGVPLNRMEMMSKGESDPKAPNDTKDGRAQNRRTDISVVG